MYLITVSDITLDEECLTEYTNEQVFGYELYVHLSKVEEVVAELNNKVQDKYFSYIQCSINDSY